ncbi:MAG: efflux RND transporter permease subunit [Candidatus Hydrogenedentota bacterium]
MNNTPETGTPERQYRLAIRRPVTMAMLFLTLIVFGWRSYQQLPINLMPDISYPTLTVRTEYEGAAPADVEKLVTRPLEEMLSIVSGMVEISSVSSPGLSEIILEFTWDTEMNMAMQDVRDRLDLFDPPKEVTEKPVILRYDPTLDPVMRIAVVPTELPADATRPEVQAALTRIREAAERDLKSDLEARSGIAQIEVKGGRELEVQVLVDSESLKNKGLSLEDVERALDQQNINLSGGRLEEGKTEYLVRTVNEYPDVKAIGRTVIAALDTGIVYLENVAEVYMGSKERDTVVHINNREAVELDIYKEGDANTVAVCNDVKDLLGFQREPGLLEQLTERLSIRTEMRLAEDRGQPLTETEARALIEKRRRANTLLDQLPRAVDLSIITDQSRFIQGSIDEVRQATVYGGILALIILFLFLRELRATLIIGIAIPISVIATFVPMFMRDISLNIMSLGGLALGVGMLVDNSIVVLESIFRCKEEGDDLVNAAERGTKEVGSAVTASTLTTISVFFPLVFVEGIAGQLFGDLALTVTFSLFASLLSALYLIPMIASRRPIAFTAEGNVVWILRAYHDGRAKEGLSPLPALAGIVPRALSYASDYLRNSQQETFGPTLKALRNVREPTFARVMIFLGALIFFPVLCVLWPLQVLVRAIATVCVTVFFLVALLFLSVFVAIRFVLRLLLVIPLWLFDTAFNAVRIAYSFIIRHSLRFGPILLAIVILLAVHAFLTARELGQELIPPMRQGEFGIRMESPPGTRLNETETRARRLERLIRQHELIESVTVEIGSDESESHSDRGENIAEFTVRMADPENNARFQDTVINSLRQTVRQNVTADEDITFTLPSLFSFKTAIEVQIVGEDLDMLRVIGRDALEQLDSVAGLTDAELSVQPGYPELIITFDRQRLAAMGLTPGTVADRLRREVAGVVATRLDQAGEKIDVRVRTDQALLQDKSDLLNIAVADGNPPVSLDAVATVEEKEGPSEIRRIQQRQVVLITGNVEGRDLAAVSEDIVTQLNRLNWPADYYYELGGQNRELEVSYASLRFALILAIFLVYVVMACQFESIWHPALVMFSVPLAFIGVIYMLDWLAMDISIMVFLGGIILAGIVVNDAIVLVDYINQLRARGLKKRDAIIEAGQVRLRPIIMTTVTTVLGLLPMALASGEGAELRQPMAVTVMAGLTSATVLTLVIIPIVYDIFGGRDKPVEEQG